MHPRTACAHIGNRSAETASKSSMRKIRFSILDRFAQDDGGTVAMTFGLMFTAMFMFIGAAVDFARWQHARTQTWQALDTAVLAGARALQLNAKDPSAAAVVAQRFYDENVKGRLPLASDTISFSSSDSGTAVAATGNAKIRTIFLGIAGIETIPLFNDSAARMPKAKLAIGGNSETNIEISLMLDITGSMRGQKIADLKDAAKDLVDIVVWADQSQFTSRVALVPFSEAVNVGSTYANLVRGSRAATISIDTGNNGNGQGNNGNNGNGSNGHGNGNNSATVTYYLTNCVSERSGVDYAFTDDAPSVSSVGPVYTQSGNCNPANKIVPLTSNTTTLKNAIDQYEANGYTAGHIGTAWAWYMLSPNWNEVWPTQSEAGSYALLSEKNKFGYAKLRKIAVLMTDGDYNTQYCANGVSSQEMNCGTPLGESTAQAKKLCTAMKDKGITVYTVGFQVSNSAKQFLQQCASSNSSFYDAEDGAGLKQAFNDIALKISNLYLSQ